MRPGHACLQILLMHSRSASVLFGRRPQEYVMALPPRIRKLAERAAARQAKAGKLDIKFSWIYDRPLTV